MFLLLLSYPVFHPVDSRATGMGCAFTAIADDEFAYFWNPGGMAFGENGLGFYYERYMDVPGLSVNSMTFLSGNKNMKFGGGWIRTATSFYQGGYDMVDTTSASDNIFSFGMGTRITPNMGVGIVLHRYLFTCFDGSKSGRGFDFGIRYRFSPVWLGFVARNLFSSSGDEYYPTIYRAGIGFLGLPKERIKRVKKGEKIVRVRERYGYRVAVSLDVERRAYAVRETDTGWNEGVWHWFLGIEYSPLDILGIRCGFSDVEKWSVGLTLGYSNFLFEFSYGGDQETIGRRMRMNFKVKQP